jgi:hypothetical protein
MLWHVDVQFVVVAVGLWRLFIGTQTSVESNTNRNCCKYLNACSPQVAKYFHTHVLQRLRQQANRVAVADTSALGQHEMLCTLCECAEGLWCASASMFDTDA